MKSLLFVLALCGCKRACEVEVYNRTGLAFCGRLATEMPKGLLPPQYKTHYLGITDGNVMFYAWGGSWETGCDGFMRVYLDRVPAADKRRLLDEVKP